MYAMKKVGIIQDTSFFDHRITENSKECPERVRQIYLDIDQEARFEQLLRMPARLADEQQIGSVHSQHYMKQIVAHAVKHDPYSYDSDTYLMTDSPHVARLAAGSCIALSDSVMEGEIETGFALLRPPGHHAEIGRGTGFCIYNNVAIMAQHLIDRHGLERILIIDFDVHHGNGTQEIFYQRKDVLTLSIHQNNIFPFSGKSSETGQGEGEGYNINIPVPSQFGDTEYSYLFGTVIQNVMDHYLPQAVLVSAGYDGHIDDPISQTEITTEGYRAMVRALRYFAQNIDAQLLFVLEGGYNPRSLSDSIQASLHAILESMPAPGFLYSSRAIQVIKNEWSSELKQKWLPTAL